MAEIQLRRFKINIDPESPKVQGLKKNDIVIRQYIEAGLTESIYTVMVVVNTGFDEVVVGGKNKKSHWFIGDVVFGDIPVEGQLFDFVRITSLSDLDRMGAMFLTANDYHSPYMDVIDQIGIEHSLLYPTSIENSITDNKSTISISSNTYGSVEMFDFVQGINNVFRINKTSQNTSNNEDLCFYKKILTVDNYQDDEILVSFKVRSSESFTDTFQVQTADGFASAISKPINISTDWTEYVFVFKVDIPTKNAIVRFGQIASKQSGFWVEYGDINIIPVFRLISWYDAVKTRMGKLTGIVDPVFGTLKDYGLYTNRLYATKDVNIAGTLTAGDANGYASTFYAGKIRKNLFLNSLNPTIVSGASVISESNPVGFGEVLQLNKTTLTVKAQTKEWLVSSVNREIVVSFYMYLSYEGMVSIKSNHFDVGVVNAEIGWSRYSASVNIHDYTYNSDLNISVEIPSFDVNTVCKICGFQIEFGKYLTAHQPTDDTLADTNEYGVWANRGGFGGTIQNPLLALRSDGSIFGKRGNFIIDSAGDAYFKGNIEAGSGYIAKWSIKDNAIYKGNIEINSDGYIKNISGAWSLNDDGSAVFSGGNVNYNIDGSGNICSDITWNNKGELNVARINATIGSIGGWTIADNKIYSGNVSLSSIGDISNELDASTYWKLRSDGSASFSLLKVLFNSDGSGKITDSIFWDVDGNISVNKITATSGSIAGWIIGAESLTGGNIEINKLGYIKSSDAASTYWSLNNDGSSSFAKGAILFNSDSSGKITDAIYWDENGDLAVNKITAKEGTIGSLIIGDSEIFSDKIHISAIDGMYFEDRTGESPVISWKLSSDGSVFFLAKRVLFNYDGSGKITDNITWDSDGSLSVNKITASSGTIASWNISSTSISNQSISIDAVSGISNGAFWAINNDGSGQLASGSISWSIDGSVAFSDNVKLQWVNHVEENAFTERLTYIDSTGVYTGTLTADQVNAVNISASSIQSGTLSSNFLTINSEIIVKADQQTGNGALTFKDVSDNVLISLSTSGLVLNSGEINLGLINSANNEFNFKAQDDGVVYMKQVYGDGWNIVNGKAEFSDISITNINAQSGYIGNWCIDSDNGIYNGDITDSVIINGVFNVAPKTHTIPANLNGTNEFLIVVSNTITASYSKNTITIPSTTVGCSNNLTKDGKKYTRYDWYLKMLLKNSSGKVIKQIVTPYVVVLGTDSRDKSPKITIPEQVYSNIDGGNLTVEIYAIFKRIPYVSGTNVGTGRGSIDSFTFSANVKSVEVSEEGAFTQLHPTKFLLKKSDSQYFSVYMDESGVHMDLKGTFNWSVEGGKTSVDYATEAGILTNGITIGGQFFNGSQALNVALDKSSVGLGNVRNIAQLGQYETAADSSKLGGRQASDYWHKANSNLNTVDWNAKNLTLAHTLYVDTIRTTSGTWLLGSNDNGANISLGSASATDSVDLNTVFGTVLTANKSGRVGIGVANPNDKLHIDGFVKTNMGSLSIVNTVASAAWARGVEFRNSTDTAYTGGFGFYGEGQTIKNFSIGFNASWHNQGLFTLLTNGNVGIGTNTPSAKLDVNGNAIIKTSLLVKGEATTYNVDAVETNISTQSATYLRELADVTITNEVANQYLKYDGSKWVNSGISYSILTDKPNIPNVPSWALASSKPTYTANEVGAATSIHTHSIGAVDGLQAALNEKLGTNSTAVDSLKLGGKAASDYYNIHTANNSGIDWSVKELFVNPVNNTGYKGALFSDITSVGLNSWLGDKEVAANYGQLRIYKDKMTFAPNSWGIQDGKTIWHAGNSNVSTIDWNARNLYTGNGASGGSIHITHHKTAYNATGLFWNLKNYQYGGFIGMMTKTSTEAERILLGFSDSANNPAWTTHMGISILPNGYVGIGTGNPSKQLEVWNASTASIQVTNPKGTIRNTVDSAGNAILVGSADLYFQTANTDRMIIKAGGNIGIGTISPTEKLQVSGNISASIFKSLGNDSGIILGADKGGGATIKYNSDGNLHLIPRSGYNSVFTNGFVKVNEHIQCDTYRDTTGAYLMGIDTTTKIMGVGSQAGGAVNVIKFDTNGAERMRIQSDGKVGINQTTDIAATLDVNGSIRGRGNVWAQNPKGVDKQGTYIELGKYAGSLPGYPNDYYPTIRTDYHTLYFSANNKFSGGIYSDNTNTAFYLTNNFDKSEVVRIDGKNNSYVNVNGGNFGIGTRVPRAGLDIAGYDRAAIIGTTTSVGNSGKSYKLRLGLATTEHSGSQYWCFGIDDNVTTAGRSKLRIGYTLADTTLTIDADKKVGINTTNPTYTLHVNGNLGVSDIVSSGAATIYECSHFKKGHRNNYIYVECDKNFNHTGRGAEINCYDATLQFQYHTNMNIGMCFGGGSVAVGASNPTGGYKLDVAGNELIRGNLIVKGEATTYTLDGVQTTSSGMTREAYVPLSQFEEMQNYLLHQISLLHLEINNIKNK